MFNKYMKQSVIIDGRRIFNSDMCNLVACYRGIGLGIKRERGTTLNTKTT